MTFQDPDPDMQAIERAMGENIRLGYIELIGVGDDGEPRYKLTSAGIAHVEKLLGET